MQQLVISAVKEDVVALVDDDEGDCAHDAAVGARFHAGHALRIGARDEGPGDPGAERGPQRGGKIFFIDQPHLDIGAGRGGRDAAYSSAIFCIAATRSTLPPPITARRIGWSKRRIPRGGAPIRRSEPNESARNPRVSSAAEKRVNCAGAPGNEPGGAGCLPEAANAAVNVEIRKTNAANDLVILILLGA